MDLKSFKYPNSVLWLKNQLISHIAISPLSDKISEATKLSKTQSEVSSFFSFEMYSITSAGWVFQGLGLILIIILYNWLYLPIPSPIPKTGKTVPLKLISIAWLIIISAASTIKKEEKFKQKFSWLFWNLKF